MVEKKVAESDTDFSEIFQDLKNNVDTLMTDFIARQNEDSVFPNPGVYTYYKNYNNRIIWLSDEIYRESTVPIIKNILIWNREDEAHGVKQEERKPIKLMINSYGGDIDALKQSNLIRLNIIKLLTLFLITLFLAQKYQKNF